MADTIAPILDMQTKQDDSKIKSQKAFDKTAINKKGLDLSDDARQEKKDQKDFKKCKNTDSSSEKASAKSKGSDKKGSNQALSKGNEKGSKQDSQKAKGGFKEEGSNTWLSKDAQESAQEAGEWLLEKGGVALEKTKDVAQAVVEKGSEWLGGNDNSQKQSNEDSSRQAGEFKQETGEWFNEKCNQVVEKTKDVAQSAIDMGKEWLGDSNQSDKDEKSSQKDENKKNTNKGDSKQETGEWLKEKGSEFAEKSKETAKAALDKGQELLDESNKSSKDSKEKEGSDKKKKSGEGKKKQAVNPGPMMFKDNTSVIEPPNDNQRSMKENNLELPSVRTAATVGKGRETPQERLQTGKGQFKHDKQASKHDREQIASSIVTNVHEFEFSSDATPTSENDEAKQLSSDSSKGSTQDDNKKASTDGDKHEKQSEKSNTEEKETKKNEDDIPRGSISKKRGNLEESGEWKELLTDSDRTFSIDKASEKKESGETPNTEDHLQSLISDIEKSQQEYSEERKKHLEMAQDPELSAFERIKAAGLALADGAMELTEAGRKKIAELYATPSVTVDEDEFKGEKKDESS